MFKLKRDTRGEVSTMVDCFAPAGVVPSKNLCRAVVTGERTVAARSTIAPEMSDKIQLRKKGDVNKSGRSSDLMVDLEL